MKKTILITGSTDGIGLETAKKLISLGHKVLIHGRNLSKLQDVQKLLGGEVESYLADLSSFDDIKKLANDIKSKHKKIDVLINNAGVYKTSNPITKDGLDVRYMVNTIAPYLLTKELLECLDTNSRVVNLSSAAQAPVNLEALKGGVPLGDGEAYAQSKLAITMWTNYLAKRYKQKIGVIVSVNPASFLGSKMVKEAYGMSGKDINIGVDILIRASLSDEFKDESGKYFDNDIGEFTDPYIDALDMKKCESVVDTIEEILSCEV